MARTRRNDKRERLIHAADALIREKNYFSTTLADIATRANVPLGNVYYYFKTKDEILDTVIDERRAALHEALRSLDSLPAGTARLMGLVEQHSARKEDAASFGCDLGNLCHELAKHETIHNHKAATLLHDLIAWAQSQFQVLGHTPSQSLALAHALVGALQGNQLLALIFKDPSLMEGQGKLLCHWLQEGVKEQMTA